MRNGKNLLEAMGLEKEKAERALGLAVAQQSILNIAGTVLVAGYDPKDGTYRLLNLGFLRELAVLAEASHILGILNGGTEDVDLQTLAVPAGAIVGTTRRESLTVPTGEVWFLNNVITTLVVDATATITSNWRCSLWADPAGLTQGQAFHPAALAAPVVQWDDFHPVGPLWLATSKQVALRLPAGTILTFEVYIGGANATGSTQTFQVFGWKGRPLID